MRLHISWARPPKLNHPQRSDIHLTHCHLCGTACSGAAGLVNHYRSSPRHPKCPRCGTGFYDSKALETVRSFLIWTVTGRIEHGVGGIARYRETPTDDVLRSFRRHRGPRRALLQLDEPQALRLLRDRVQGGERFARGTLRFFPREGSMLTCSLSSTTAFNIHDTLAMSATRSSLRQMNSRRTGRPVASTYFVNFATQLSRTQAP